jgi:hypothetical protein
MEKASKIINSRFIYFIDSQEGIKNGFETKNYRVSSGTVD